MTAPFLIIGSSGMLGRAMIDHCTHFALPFSAVDVAELDLTNPRSINACVTRGVRFVINCAAYTDVDGAETSEALATAINATGVRSLADRCGEVGAKLVTYSTDYVFRGDATRPYQIDEPRAPINAYGRSKARGEELLEACDAHWINIRTSWLYAPWGKNFVLTIRGLLLKKPSIKVVDDQRGRPTSAEHLASCTLRLLDIDSPRGHYHVTDGGECSWFGLAQEIGRLVGAPGIVEPCTSAEFPRPAKRPAYSVLDLEGTEAVLGMMPDWKHNLAEVLARVKA